MVVAHQRRHHLERGAVVVQVDEVLVDVVVERELDAPDRHGGSGHASCSHSSAPSASGADTHRCGPAYGRWYPSTAFAGANAAVLARPEAEAYGAPARASDHSRTRLRRLVLGRSGRRTTAQHAGSRMVGDVQGRAPDRPRTARRRCAACRARQSDVEPHPLLLAGRAPRRRRVPTRVVRHVVLPRPRVVDLDRQRGPPRPRRPGAPARPARDRRAARSRRRPAAARARRRR